MSINNQAIALLRVSTDEQAGRDRAGLPAQRVEIERVAAAHSLDVVEWVQLEGVSGTAVLEDPRFDALLERLKAPEIVGVVVAAFDRLFRHGKFGDYAILDAFADTGSAIYSAEGRLDPAQESDGLLSVLHGELAGMERRRIRARTMKAKEVRRRAGFYPESVHTLPYGVTYRVETGPDGAPGMYMLFVL